MSKPKQQANGPPGPPSDPPGAPPSRPFWLPADIPFRPRELTKQEKDALEEFWVVRMP
jgi:hypothetical protein